MMSIKSFFFLLFLFLFSACSSQKVVIKGYEKVFPEEDKYIVLALHAEQLQANIQASKLFDILYEKSTKKEYLHRSLSNLLIAKKYEDILLIAKKEPDDLFTKRMEVIALINLFQMKEAETKALNLVKLSKKADDYLLVSDLYVSQKKFDKAVKYLESAYMKDYNEKILDRISIILYVNLGRKNEAIAQLETHSRVYSCSKLICTRLISFYSDENNIDGLLSAYLRYYKVNPDERVSKKIVQIYQYKKEYLKLIDFLKETKSDDNLLLELYLKIKNYKKAFLLAEYIYKETGDIEYLGKSAIYEYESKQDNLKSEDILSISKKFEKVIAEKNTALYLNYYGYLLIDHEIDIKKGIKYIKKALKIQPKASFYMDSLAWGYYKQGRCKKAKSIMNKVIKLDGGTHEEILSHIKSIDNCLNTKKEKNDFR